MRAVSCKEMQGKRRYQYRGLILEGELHHLPDLLLCILAKAVEYFCVSRFGGMDISLRFCRVKLAPDLHKQEMVSQSGSRW